MILLVWLGCAASRPEALSAFHGIWHDGCALGPNAFAPGLAFVRGEGSVLSLDVDWGGSYLVTDTKQFAALLLELPSDPEAGDVTFVAGRRAQYREGGRIVGYEATEFTGSVGVTSVDAAGLTLTLDLKPATVAVDNTGWPPIPLVGPITVPRNGTCGSP